VADDYWGGGCTDVESDSDSDSEEEQFTCRHFDDAFYRPGTHTPRFGGPIRNGKNVSGMIARIEKLCDVYGDRFWIGKFSNGRAGIRNRWNTKYKHEYDPGPKSKGIWNLMAMRSAAIIFETTSETLAYKAEKELIEHFEDQDMLQNPVSGGGGKKGQSGSYGVYLMWDEW
jgi:hypothetical protein